MAAPDICRQNAYKVVGEIKYSNYLQCNLFAIFAFHSRLAIIC